MLKRSLLFVLFAISVFTSSLFGQKIFIHCGNLIDGNSDKLIQKKTIIVEGAKIADIKDGFVTPSEKDFLIDLSDKTVMPGLMDMHTHLSGEFYEKVYMEDFYLDEADLAYRSTIFAEKTLMAGFTTVREVGGSVSNALRDAINKGWVKGPRIYSAGRAIATTGGHADPTSGLNSKYMGNPGPDEGVINGPDDARQAVRQRYKEGSDLIKITATGGVLSTAKSGQNPQFTMEELQAIIETANDYDMHVAAHAHGAEGMKRAIKAGVLTIEHGTLMDDEVINLMKEHGTYYVPTIMAGEWVSEKAQIEGYFPDIVRPKAAEIGPKIQSTFAKAFKAGVKIAFGTDSGVSAHGDNAREFELMVEAGMPAMEAIKSATKTTAELLKIDDKLGILKKGKIADIIAVEGNPLEDIKNMHKVVFVMKEGLVYKFPE